MLFTNLTEDFCVSSAAVPLWKNEAFHTAIEYSHIIHKHHNLTDWEFEFVYEYGKADLFEIKRRLNHIDWQTLFEKDTIVDNALHKFYSVFYEIIDLYIPKRKRRRHNTRDPPWFTKELKTLRNRKQRAHKNFKSSVGTIDEQKFWLKYLEICDNLNSSLTIAQEEYHRKVENDIKSNSKQFFAYVKTKQKSNNFPSSMYLGDKVGNNSEDICNLFADFFESVYTFFPEADRDREYFSNLPEPHSNIMLRELSLDEIKEAIKGIDGSKGPGPDGIPPLIIKNLTDELTEPLFRLFNLSLSTRKFPSEWKKSFLVPIFKSGKKSSIENYRGVAIISCIPKLFEAIVNVKLFNQLKHVISENQHGFFKGRSTATNLLQFVTFSLKAMDNGNSVQTLYTDFSKAFDRIDIPMLLFKLEKIGIENTLLEWLGSYLTNRTQLVKFNGKTSRCINVSSGVPQGSHLGPLLFILFINDVSLFSKHIKILSYADDMKLYMEIVSPSDINLFQSEVNIFHEWCEKSLLKLNIKKCNIVCYTRKHLDSNINISLGNQNVTRCNKIRDLGVILDSKLSFTEHYNSIIHKASNILSFIKRFTYNFNDPYTLKALYISYVRSILEYCSIVWSPYLVTHSDRIESVQKQFVLFALRKLGWSSFPLPSYDSRCMLISLDSLAKRREFACLSFVNDIVSNRIDSPVILQNINFYAPGRALRTRSLFLENAHRTNYAKNCPINRIMKTYNTHSETIDLTMTKNSLKKHFFRNIR